MNTSQASPCKQCGSEMPVNAPGGLCPRCLMAMNMAEPTCLLDEDSLSAAAAPPPAPEEIAPLFPSLEILECLGRGGMGVVYKARQKSLNRLVALKILAPERVKDPAFAKRFVVEAEALARLNHANIVTIHDFGQADGLFYFVMEYVDGLNLRQLLHSGRIAPREALAIVPQICDALQYAHDAGIVHRDIKPENILLDRLGRVKVADFGLAKLVGQAEPGPSGTAAAAAPMTEGGKVIGTPQYMAPEQTDHPSEVDHRADIYSLGVVFYQMLTGEMPGRKLEPPSKKVVIDVRLDEVVLRALEANPERRYQQVSQVKTMVESIVAEGRGQKLEVRGQKSEVGIKCRTAIVGAVLTALGILLTPFLVWMAVQILEDSHWNPSTAEAIFTSVYGGTWLLCAGGGALLGCVALTHIRRSAGRLQGLGLALFDALLFPLLAILFAVAGVCRFLAKVIVDFHANPSVLNNPNVHPAFMTRLGNYLSQYPDLPSIAGTALAVVLGFLIVRAVWRAVNKPADSAVPPVSAPEARTSRFGKLALMLCIGGICLLAVGLSLSAIRQVLRDAAFLELAAFLLGILGWKSRAGKAAVILILLQAPIAALLLPLVQMPGTHAGSRATAAVHDPAPVPRSAFSQAGHVGTAPGYAQETVDITRLPGGPWIAAVPGGATVELVALAPLADSNAPAWRPDGEFASEPFHRYSAQSRVDGKVMRVAAFRIRGGSPEGVSVKVRCEDKSGIAPQGGGTRQAGQAHPYAEHLEQIACPPDLRTANIQVAVATEPWQVVGHGDPESNNNSWGDRDGNAGTCSCVSEKNGQAMVTLTRTQYRTDVDLRVRAIGSDGKEHQASEVADTLSGDLGHQTITFRELSAKDIQRLQIQRRPFHWVEFRNVALQPDPTGMTAGGTAVERNAGAAPPAAGSSVERRPAIMGRILRPVAVLSVFALALLAVLRAGRRKETETPAEAKAQRRGRLALALCISGMALPAALLASGLGPQTPRLMIALVPVILLACLCELAAIVLGIVGWKSGAGKAAVIAAALLPVLFLPGVAIAGCATALYAAAHEPRQARVEAAKSEQHRATPTVHDPAPIPLAFGPVIERTLTTVYDNTQPLRGLNLETGEFQEPPPELANELRDAVGSAQEGNAKYVSAALLDWLRQSGSDVVAGQFPDDATLWFIDRSYPTIMGSDPSLSFDTITPAKLVFPPNAPPAPLDPLQLRAAHLVRLHAQNIGFILFTTHGGRQGVMEAAGFTDNPRGVKIRYKLVTSEESAGRKERDGAAPTDLRRYTAVRTFVYHATSRADGCAGDAGPTGCVRCGYPGAVSEVTWAWLRATPQGDVYRFTRVFPYETPEAQTTVKEVTYAGGTLVVWEDAVHRIGLEIPHLRFRRVAETNDTAPTDELADPNDTTGEKKLRVLREVLLDETAVAGATVVTNRSTGHPEIAITFTPAGAQQFAAVTRDNMMKRLAIIFAGKLLSAPTIRGGMSNGLAVISGTFSEAEAAAIAAALNAGKPVTVEIPAEVDQAWVMKYTQGDLGAATNELERFYGLRRAARTALKVGQTETARQLATELADLAPKYKGNWNYGNAIQGANQVLGQLALAEGNVEEAKKRLLASADSKGSPQMNSFGPNMQLAKELLAKGEREVVLEYFKRCGAFWTMGTDRLAAWAETVNQGQMPDFGANLEY